MKNIIEKITKISEKKQVANIRYFAKLPIDNQVEIFDKTTKLFHKMKNEYTQIPNHVLTYISFIIIIATYKNDEEFLKNANFKDLTLNQIYQLTQKRIKIFKNSIKKRSAKNEKLMEYWSLVVALKEQQLSYRQISMYLSKYHHFVVSASKIFNKWKEMEKNGKIERNC